MPKLTLVCICIIDTSHTTQQACANTFWSQHLSTHADQMEIFDLLPMLCSSFRDMPIAYKKSLHQFKYYSVKTYISCKLQVLELLTLLVNELRISEDKIRGCLTCLFSNLIDILVCLHSNELNSKLHFVTLQWPCRCLVMNLGFQVLYLYGMIFFCCNIRLIGILDIASLQTVLINAAVYKLKYGVIAGKSTNSH